MQGFDDAFSVHNAASGTNGAPPRAAAADKLYVDALGRHRSALRLTTTERKLAALHRRHTRRTSLIEVIDADDLDGLEEAEPIDEGAALLAHDAVREATENVVGITIDSPEVSPKPSRPASLSNGLHTQPSIRFHSHVRIAGGSRRKPNEHIRRVGSRPTSILISNALIGAGDERAPLLSTSPRTRRPSMSVLYGTSPQLSTEAGTRASSPAPSLYVPLTEAASTAPSPERLLAWLATAKISTKRRPSRLGSESGYRAAVEEAQAAYQRRRRRKRIKRFFQPLLFWTRWYQSDQQPQSPTEEEEDAEPTPVIKSETEVRFGSAPGRWFTGAWWASRLRSARVTMCCGAETDDDSEVVL